MANSFFIQHKLFGIVNGTDTNPAGNVLPQSYDGEVRLASDEILADADRDVPGPVWSEDTKAVWEWNKKHTLVHGFLKGSLIDESAAYAKIIDCTTANEIWVTLAKEYGQSSNVMLRVLEGTVATLYKDDSTSMGDHIDKYSQMIEQIQYHLEPKEKWSNERIIRTFFGTLDGEKWGAYEDALGNTITDMLPTDLYARIKARDAAKRQNEKNATSTINGVKKANFTNFTNHSDLKIRIGNGNGNGNHQRSIKFRGRGKRNNAKNFGAKDSPYRRPDKEYIKRMKQQWGDDYIECSHCHFPGHTSDNCRRRGTTNKGYNQQNHHGNYTANFTGNIANITEYEALSSERRLGNDPYLWSIDSACNIHLTPYKSRFITYNEFQICDEVKGLNGHADVLGSGSVELEDMHRRKHTLHNVLYVPDAQRPLLSLAKLMREGFEMLRTNRGTNFYLLSDKSNIVLPGGTINDLFHIWEHRSPMHELITTTSLIATHSMYKRALRDEEDNNVQIDLEDQMLSENENFIESSDSQPIRSQHSSPNPTIHNQATIRPKKRTLQRNAWRFPAARNDPQPSIQEPSISASPPQSRSQLIEPTNGDPDHPNNGTSDPGSSDPGSRSFQLWHQRLAHMSYCNILNLGLISRRSSSKPIKSLQTCDACAFCKITRLPYRPYQHQAISPLWRVHSNMSGIQAMSIDGYQYYITFVDDYSRYCWVYFTKRKDTATIRDIYEQWQCDAVNKANQPVSFLQTDGGGEYQAEMAKILKDSYTMHLLSTPYQHESNGLAERQNRTLKDDARTLMKQAKIPHKFWTKAAKAACDIRNYLTHSALKALRTPHSSFFREWLSSSLGRFKIF
jgi:transposase InsO family protein